MPEPLQTAYRAGTQRRAIHHGRIKLNFAEQIRPATTSYGADLFVILDEPDASLDRVEPGAAISQQFGGQADAGFTFVVGQNNHVLSFYRQKNADRYSPTRKSL